MELSLLDIAVFLGFIGFVVAFSMWKSRKEETSEDYFLAGRGLVWPLIGLSIVAANLSTEQFVGMAGQGAGNVGLAVSNWQILSSIAIIIVAFYFLPRFLRAGIYTMPEYLEYRYNAAARALMAVSTVIIYVTVLITTVIYSGAIALQTIFDMKLAYGVLLIGAIAGLYTIWGGLKAVAWADLFQGSALMIGGFITMFLGLRAVGGVDAFMTQNADRLHMILPKEHPVLPWTGLLAGIWIPIFYYSGLNQFIVQRTLAARDLRQGQLGIIFAAALWILVPFFIVFPGIMAAGLYKTGMAEEAAKSNQPVLGLLAAHEKDPAAAGIAFAFDEEFAALQPQQAEALAAFNAQALGQSLPEGLPPAEANRILLEAVDPQRITIQKELMGYKYDAAFPLMVRHLIPPGVRGFIFAALAGAIISSIASMLNSASTIFTMDLYKRHLRKHASQANLILTGRLATLCFVILGCLLAPQLDNPRFGGVFNFIQKFQGYISPGILAAFVFGFIVKRTPPAAGVAALIGCPLIYGTLDFFWSDKIVYLNMMALTFGLVVALMALITLAAPLKQPKAMPVVQEFDTRPSPFVLGAGLAVIACVVAFYVVFW